MKSIDPDQGWQMFGLILIQTVCFSVGIPESFCFFSRVNYFVNGYIGKQCWTRWDSEEHGIFHQALHYNIHLHLYKCLLLCRDPHRRLSRKVCLVRKWARRHWSRPRLDRRRSKETCSSQNPGEWINLTNLVWEK